MKQKLGLFGMLLVLSAPMYSKYHSVSSERELESLVNKYPYAVVCFAPSTPLEDGAATRDEKREVRHEFKGLQSKVKSAADRDKYRHYLGKDVGFLVVDVANKRAQEVTHDYALEQFPSCLVFQSGAVAGKQPLIHPTSPAQIVKTLENQYGDKIEKMVKERKEDERLLREERIASYYAYGNYPYGWGWAGPYGYYHYGMGGYPFYGNWGFGIPY